MLRKPPHVITLKFMHVYLCYISIIWKKPTMIVQSWKLDGFLYGVQDGHISSTFQRVKNKNSENVLS